MYLCYQSPLFVWLAGHVVLQNLSVKHYLHIRHYLQTAQPKSFIPATPMGTIDLAKGSQGHGQQNLLDSLSFRTNNDFISIALFHVKHAQLR